MSKTILITALAAAFGRDTGGNAVPCWPHCVRVDARYAGQNREAAEALRKLGIMTVELDVSDERICRSGRQKVLAEAGKIDVLITTPDLARPA